MNKVRGFGTVAAAGMILLLAAAPAFAHPTVVSRTPADGSTVDQPPSEVEVEFDEVVTNADLNVFDPCGDQVDTGNTQTLGTNASVGMIGDKAGTYTVQWKVISEDGHSVGGDWTFTSSGGAACPGSGGGDNGGGNGGNQPGGSGNGGGSANGGGSDPGGSGGTGGSDNPTVGAGGGNNNGNGGSNGKHGDHKDHGKNSKDNKNKKHDHPKSDAPTEPGPIAGDEGPGSSSMPMDWLFISFGIAALIGAAAGTIYVNISNPR